MKEPIHFMVEPEFHACLKEISKQKGITMTDWVKEKIFDEILRDKDGKVTDGESWIDDYKERQRRKVW